MQSDATAANFRPRSVMGNKMAGVKVEYNSDPKETDEQIEGTMGLAFGACAGDGGERGRAW